ncbi:MAG: hypothetical protein LBU25_07885 [Treponema sp.]|jgi:hypothetical protein|nr:hypothetical protein [Treponema sp.]
MVSKSAGYTLPLVWGVFLLIGCVTKDNHNDDIDRGLTKTEAFFPVVDALSSASILRADSHTMVYVGERTGTNYWLNKVDVNSPEEKTSRNIGGNVAVISAAANGGRIGIIQAVEYGYEAFTGVYTKIYDADSLGLLKTFALAPPAAEGRTVEPLHHRDPSLAISDTYAVVLTEDDGFFAGYGAQQYVSVYAIAGDKKASHTNAFSGNPGAARGDSNPALGVGTLMGAAVNGDYIILGGSTGTAVFKIDASGETLAISGVANSDGIGNHWFKDNGSYVLEPKSNTGKVKVWKWNGADAPTAVGEVDVNGNNSGSVQALCFDPENPAIAYFYCKLADGTGNAGNVYSVNLSTADLPKTALFQFSKMVIQVSGRGGSAYYDCPLTGLWTIEKQQARNDTYFVFSGQLSYTPSGGSAATLGTVLTVKNPPSDGSAFGGSYIDANNATLDSKVREERFTAPFGTAVRTLKTFKSTRGDIYVAAKNYTANGAASQYKLVLEKIN